MIGYMAIKGAEMAIKGAEEDEILTSADVARLFKVDVMTVRRWSLDGRLSPAFRTPGGHRRYRRSQVELFLRGGDAD
jgi:excisionase family DNA binding protein